jgi:subtilisin family serine protease
MKNHILFCVIFLAALLTTSALARQPAMMPDRWFVELADAPTLEYRGAQAALAEGGSFPAGRPAAATAPALTGQDRFDARAQQVVDYAAYLDRRRLDVLEDATRHLGRELQPRAVLRHVSNAFSVEMSAEEAARMADLPGVRAVHPVYLHQVLLQDGPELIGARDLAAGFNGLPAANGEGVVIGILDSGIDWNHQYFSDDPLLGGHEYTNPYDGALGLCTSPEVSCNNKLVGVYDFTPAGTQGEDTDGHGTHVASIAAGVPLPGGFAGVAPSAHIISYKVCYESLPDDPDASGCPHDGVLQALDQAIEDGVDVVNYSIGLSGGLNPWPNAQALFNLRDAGITFVAAAGNEGPDFGSMSFPADAPWVLAVGSSTHKRRSHNAIEVAGIGSLFIQYGTGPGPQEPSIVAAPLMSADEVAADMLACNPFPADAFADAVALVERGECNFSVKVGHAADAGALAVVVINNVPGDTVGMAGLEDTTIPAGMVTQTDGQAILAAIASAAGSLAIDMPTDLVSQIDVAWQDQISHFSSRGPSPYVPNLVKPNVVAPGQSILAGSISGPAATRLANGTSMASPHVAGAVAQLRQLNPDWSPNVLQSVLETTAEVETLSYLDQPANIMDRGNGRIRVDRAAHAGLYLPVTRQQFVDADPSAGGNPGDLNLAGIMVEECAGMCSVTRTVEALQAGSWTVQTTGSLGVQVSPGSFNLQAGQQQELSISISAGATPVGGLGEGRIKLVPDNADLAEQALSVAAIIAEAVLPERLSISAESNRGGDVLAVESVTMMDEALYHTSALTRPDRESFSLAQDTTPMDPFSSGAGTRTFLVDVPEEALLLLAETVASNAVDIDLFVGRDDNGNGQADEDEMVCQSTSLDELEECLIRNPEPGSWWILVQNWQASSGDAQDNVELDIAVLSAQHDGYSLVASGVGNHPGGPMDISVYFDQPDMRRDERWVGALGISSSPDVMADIGVVPIMITRTGDNEPQATALFNGQSLAVVLPPNSRHEKLFIDVPPTAYRLEVNVQGEAGVEAGLQPTVYDSLGGFAPGTPPPPPGAIVSGSGSADGIDLAVGDLFNPTIPARYYVVLENTSNQERLVEVRADLIELGRQTPRFGLWSPRSRVIFQGIEWQQAGPGFMMWYSYDDNGLPVFYIAINDLDPDSSVWRGTLERVTGNNERQSVEVVGEVTLTTLGFNLMSFAWRLNGGHGSELITPDAPQTCPEVDGERASYTGHWFSPVGPVGGTTAIVTDDGQFFVRYFFDGDGVGRWVFVSAPAGAELGDPLEVRDFRGHCPNCPQEPMTYDDNSQAVGIYGISFDSESSGNEVLDFTTSAPQNHDINLDVPIQKLSVRLTCWPSN